MLEHTIVSHLSKIFFFNGFVEDGIQREKRRENERTVSHVHYFIHTPFTQVTVEDTRLIER